MTTLRLGTRASALAQAQTRWLADRLQAEHSNLFLEIVLITTSGDRSAQSGSEERGVGGTGGLKAQFTKELEEALLDRRIDLAVHSLKDMAAKLPEGLILGAVPLREDARDAWISKDGTPFEQLAPGARVGTGSVRRSAQLKALRRDVDIVNLRGNVDTRLRTLKTDRLDGIILAAAGLRRLGLGKEISSLFDPQMLVPAVGQGCLAVECREQDRSTLALLSAVNDSVSRIAAEAERGFLIELGGSCQTPVAAHAHLSGETLHIQGWIGSLDGRHAWRDTGKGKFQEAAVCGRRLARRLLDAGAKI